jgi:hypothetical protein
MKRWTKAKKFQSEIISGQNTQIEKRKKSPAVQATA